MSPNFLRLAFIIWTFFLPAAWAQEIQLPSQAQVAQLIEQWRQQSPEIYEAYQKLSPSDMQFIVLYRGLNNVPIDQVKLASAGMKLTSYNRIYTTPDLNIALKYGHVKYTYSPHSRYSNSTVMLKILIPKGFIQEAAPNIYTIDLKSEYANLSHFVTEVGFLNFAKYTESLKAYHNLGHSRFWAFAQSTDWIATDQVYHRSRDQMRIPNFCSNVH